MSDADVAIPSDILLTLVADVATIKERTARIPHIEEEVDKLRDGAAPLSEHRDLMGKVETLWNNYQRLRLVIWLVGSLNGLVALWVFFRSVKVLP
jgi:hypothetical protein